MSAVETGPTIEKPGGRGVPTLRTQAHTCTRRAPHWRPTPSASGYPRTSCASLQISEYKDVRWPAPVLRIPYMRGDGNEPAVKD